MAHPKLSTTDPGSAGSLRPILVVSMLLLLTSTHRGQSPAPAQSWEIVSPADSGSALPSLAATPDGRTLMSWVEKASGGRHALMFASLTDSSWSSPRTIAEGEGWFVNWADFPSVSAMPDGSLAAHWLERSGPGTYAYGVRIARSTDGGATWSRPITPHRDSTDTEHGFVSMFPAPGGGPDGTPRPSTAIGAVWLDGREMAGEGGEEGGAHGGAHAAAGAMTLRYAAIAPDGALSDETVLDAKVCECCQTSAATAAGGPVVVYRDRLDGEVRDISVVRWTNGRWEAPARLSRDEWKIDGCPVNGPAIDAKDNEVAVAWFTAAGDTPRVKAAFSIDGGRTFGAPVVVDDGSPLGRVDIAFIPGGGAAVSWIERAGGSGEVRVRRVGAGLTRGPSVVVAPSGTARSTGFPRMAASGSRLVIAWTGDRVRTALVSLPE